MLLGCWLAKIDLARSFEVAARKDCGDEVAFEMALYMQHRTSAECHFGFTHRLCTVHVSVQRFALEDDAKQADDRVALTMHKYMHIDN